MNPVRSASTKSRTLLSLGVLVGMLAITACSNTKPHEKAAQQKAQQEGLSQVDSRFDGTFVAPGVDFAKYKRVLLEQLDMENVQIRKPSTTLSRDTPWELSNKDKAYYQEKYTEAMMNHMLSDAVYSTATNAAADVMIIRARVLEIAPLASKDDLKGRPQITKVYSEGMGTMTLEISLFDSLSGKVLCIITDKRDLGRIWEENNRATNAVQVRIAFNAWLDKLRTELDKLSHRRK